MSPESIVTSLAISKKLKESGWAHDEAFWYWNQYKHSIEGDKWFLECPYEIDADRPYKLAIAAPTAEEIIAAILKRTDWTMALLLSNVASLILQRYLSSGVRCWREIRAARLRCW